LCLLLDPQGTILFGVPAFYVAMLPHSFTECQWKI